MCVQPNLEALLWKCRDLQITYFTVDTSGTLISLTENAGRVTIKGIDADLVLKPTRMTTLSAEVQYLDARYDNLHLFTARSRDNFGFPFTFTGQVPGGAAVKDFNRSGRRALFSPQWTVNLGAEQRVPLSDDLEIVGSVNTAWRDDQEGEFELLPLRQLPLKNKDNSFKWRVYPGFCPGFI